MDAHEFYSDPAMRVAQDMMRQGHPGVPSHSAVEHTAARAVRAQVASGRRGTRPAVTASRQARAALAGRPVRPLPTRAARKIKAKKNKMIKRLGYATPPGMIVMIALLIVLPSVLAAVTIGLVTSAMVLSLTR